MSNNDYILTGSRITKPVQLYVRDDAALRSEGLSAAIVAREVGEAAATWNRAAGVTLFTLPVKIDSSKKSDKHDAYSVVAFAPAGGFIAYARTWLSPNQQVLMEADVVANTASRWTVNLAISQSDRSIRDVQTIALHELGHFCGLGDLRGTDYSQIMSGYHGPQRMLGPGDIAGLKKIYG